MTAAFALIALAMVLSISLHPKQSSSVAVVVSPWANVTEIVEIIAKADGAIVRQGQWHWVLVAQSDASDFVSRLYSAGALAVLDPVALGACIIF